MRFTCIVLVCAGILTLAAPMCAQKGKRTAGPQYPKGVHFQANLKTALEEAALRNAPLFIAVVMDGESLNDLVATGQRYDKNTVRLSRKFVCLVTSRGRHDVVKARDAEGRIRKVCKRVTCVTCEEHARLEIWAFREYAENGEMHSPQHILCDPTGKAIERFIHHRETTAGQLNDAMERVLARVGPGIDVLAFRRHVRSFAQLDVEKRPVEALRALARMVRTAGKTPFAARVQIMVKKAETVLGAELAHIDRLIAGGNRAEARRRVEAGRRSCRGLSVARAFEDRLRILGKRPPAARDTARAGLLLSRAEASFRAKDYPTAETGYLRIVERHGETPQAAVARKRLETLRVDPAVKKALARQKMRRECERWMKLADVLLKNRRRDAALDLYRKIIDTYPGTPYAAEARKKVVTIGTGL